MKKIISRADKVLVIPPKWKFPNKDKLVIELEAKKPIEVPDYIADYYIKNYPHIYRLADERESSEGVTGDIPSGEEPYETNDTNEQKGEFNPIEFLEINHDRLEIALNELEKKNLILTAKALGLKKVENQSNERIIERIIHDIKVKSGNPSLREKKSGEVDL